MNIFYFFVEWCDFFIELVKFFEFKLLLYAISDIVSPRVLECTRHFHEIPARNAVCVFRAPRSLRLGPSRPGPWARPWGLIARLTGTLVVPWRRLAVPWRFPAGSLLDPGALHRVVVQNGVLYNGGGKKSRKVVFLANEVVPAAIPSSASGVVRTRRTSGTRAAFWQGNAAEERAGLRGRAGPWKRRQRNTH